MTQVNPPPQIKLPSAFLKDREISGYFRQLDRMLLQLWTRTGGTTDIINETEQVLTGQIARSARNTAKINAIEDTTERVVIVTANYTASPFETIICNNSSAINVTLDTNPIEGDIVHIKRNNAEVTIIGTIDGLSDMVLNVPKYTAKLAFNGTDWSRV
jgi:hypothetical protein